MSSFPPQKKSEDPPSSLNSSLAAADEIAVEMDNLKTIYSSFDTSPDVPLRLRCRKTIGWPRPANPPSDQDGSGVVRCTASASYQPPPPPQQKQKMSGVLGRPKTRSRLMDPLPPAKDDKKWEDKDPFVDDDTPEYFKKKDVLWFCLMLILATLGCTLLIPSLKRYEVCNLYLWKWEAMVLVLVSGHMLSGWVVRLIICLLQLNFLFLRKRMFYFVYEVRKAVRICLWLGFVWFGWNLILHDKIERGTKSIPLKYVNKVLLCLLLAAVIWLVKILFIKMLASSFHVSTYFDRIQESLFTQYIIKTLSGPPLIDVQKLDKDGANVPVIAPSKSGKVAGIKIDHLHNLNQKNVSAWKIKWLVRIIRYGTLTTLHQQLGHDGNGEDESAVRSEHEATIVAEKIFNNVAKRASEYIYLEDLMRFMREEEALKTMTFFEGAKDNRGVSRECLKNWMVNAFRERKQLASTLNDMKTVINTLHQITDLIVGLVSISVSLLIFKIENFYLFMVVSSLLLVVFMFGYTLKMIFESVIFLFVVHPYDVGDHCEINGVQMVVEEMNILTTTFLRSFDKQKVIFTNKQLSSFSIGNYFRSPGMEDSIDFSIHRSTPVEKVATLKQRLTSYMENRPEHWYPGLQIIFKEVEGMNRLRISIRMRHASKFQDMKLRWNRRELVMLEMIKVLSELEIEHSVMPLD